MKYLIGIDPGVTTGFCLYNKTKAKIEIVTSYSIIVAMEVVKEAHKKYGPDNIELVIEDARKKHWFGTGKEVSARAQGAGSVKRDTKVWIEFCDTFNVKYKLVEPPKDLTKIKAERFKKLTGYKGRTNGHGRDAAMLVWGY